MTAEEIYEEVWNQPTANDKRALQARVSVLCSKLSGSGFEIVSEYGKGYCFRKC